MKKKIIAIIPARSGSKGIKNKNIKKLYGKPLIAWTIDAAIKSKLIDRVIVSTDSEKIKKIAIKHGAEAPFLRPKNISLDHSRDYSLIRHCLNYLSTNGFKTDLFLYLRPTQPLRTTKEINEAIRKFFSKNRVDGLRTTIPSQYPPFWNRILTENKILKPLHPNLRNFTNMPRQKLPSTVVCDGHVDIFKASKYIKNKGTDINCLSLSKKGRVYFDLDTYADWNLCEKYMKNTKFINKIN